jgi:hypothetical protein
MRIHLAADRDSFRHGGPALRRANSNLNAKQAVFLPVFKHVYTG